jgi:hypothetical protein
MNTLCLIFQDKLVEQIYSQMRIKDSTRPGIASFTKLVKNAIGMRTDERWYAYDEQ